MINITWTLPYSILQNPNYTKIDIYRGTNENDVSSYKVIATLDRWIDNDYEKEVMSYQDPSGNNQRFYFVKYTDDSKTLVSNMLLTAFELTPKQQRWVNSLRDMLDPIITSRILDDGTMQPLSDTDLFLGINMALDYFNNYSPVTDFTYATFPKGGGYEFVILMFAQVFTIMNKFIGLSMRDFSYSDNGLSLNQQFTPALTTAMDKILGIINPLMQKIKMDFSIDASATLGSTMYAIGMNGRMGQFPAEVFNIFRSLTNY